MRHMSGVAIQGDGVAACCCAHLLKCAGFEVTASQGARPRLPVMMLSDAAVSLMQGVFGDLGFADFPRIRNRVVAWGAEPVKLPHSAIVISEKALLERTWRGIALDETAQPAWTVFAARPLPPGTIEHRLGSRTATVTPVTLKATADPETCWIESIENGWLFLIPTAPGSAYLLSVGGTADSLLGASRLATVQIDHSGTDSKEFAAYPRILSRLCGDGWLACGSAAMAFDPLCGDGTSHAIREAILAAAVIQAAAAGENSDELLSHYESRLIAGFGRHLALCSQFYKSADRGAWWQAELRSLEEGMAWCGERLARREDFHYQLNGFALQPVAR
jgi:hypothetical protein